MTRPRTLAFVLAAVALLGGAVLLARAVSEPSETPAAGHAATAAHASKGGGTRAAATSASNSARADRRIEQVHTEADLLRYFDDLEADARKRGHLEDELARADLAGRQLLGTMSAEQIAPRMFEFSNRMRRLEIELRVDPVMAELDKLRAQIVAERDPAKRADLVQSYQRVSGQLDVPTARLAAAERLKAALGQ